jgi:DNA-binding CsgD family transcriptional regulator
LLEVTPPATQLLSSGLHPVNTAIAVLVNMAYIEPDVCLACALRPWGIEIEPWRIEIEMERLRQRDLTALLRCLQNVYAVRDLDRFPEQVGSVLKLLIPHDFYVYAEVDGQSRTTVLVTSQPSIAAIVPDFQAVFDRHGHENPLPAAHQKHAGALKISDFLSERQFRHSSLYNELFRPASVHYQMSVVLPSREGIIRGVVVNRGTRDFSERERTLLDLVRPHLAQSRRNAEAFTQMLRALRTAGQEVVYLDHEGQIRHAGEGAQARMPPYFRDHALWDHRLPDTIERWVRVQRDHFLTGAHHVAASEPLVLFQADRRLVIRFVPGGDTEEEDLLLVEEQHVRVLPEALSVLGLSRRQAEVLSLAAQGSTPTEIGRMLVISTGTVEKHLEHIYARLGVHSRAAAVARALEALR